MKKFLALLLSLSLTFSLVACGTDKPSSETDSISSGGLEEVEDGKNSTVHQYIGEYQQEHVYQKIQRPQSDAGSRGCGRYASNDASFDAKTRTV